MDKIHQMLMELGLDTNIKIDDIPDLDLYMDQVIQLFEKKFGEVKRNDEEKVLTKTMINNYAKGKLFFPITNKKYSKEHIILISLIYQLKGALSISDIKKTLDEVNEKIINGNMELDPFYSAYLNLSSTNAAQFTTDLEEHVKEVEKEVSSLEDDEKEQLEHILLIASLVNMSNFYRRTAEKLVDMIKENKTETK
ncbi:DUF1836 domain-containing protein [Evansella tamaricis]|uniref:DUF1836 domain-containing protein n=1 Tax=Evansella tamaricis TaxID=2069301 RepID=A0ABS6JEP2_9BACI|nr:DUF1836 domain-containing protein [Evansella tamaricis]MBU9710930.1 DUF1836 domain-containing protein [Evansella tamaricis]